MHDLNQAFEVLEHIQEEISMFVPDWANYLVMQIDGNGNSIFYNISDDCPADKYRQIEKIIQHNALLLDISVTMEDIK